MRAALVFIVLYCVFVSAVLSVDPVPPERTPKGKGAKVVAKVSALIENSKIFPPHNRFLCRVAWVESRYGTHEDTYKDKNGKPYHGGIWQVDKIGYIDTKTHPAIKKYHKAILDKFGIDWTKTTWKDLRKPLYSGLAARMILLPVPAKIPPANNVPAQGEYWKKHYNKSGKGTGKKFVEDVKKSKGCADP